MREFRRGFPAFVLLASAAMLAGAYAFQYWGRLAPCELCLLERWPWRAAIAISLVAALAGSRAALPWVALGLGLVFAVGAGLAFYHVGVEEHWFAGPTACTAAGAAANSLEALRAQILHQQPVRCDVVTWSLFGLSLAGWNLLASLGMAAICFAAIPLGRRRSA
jgi:disulfide bond formation protein DsbB